MSFHTSQAFLFLLLLKCTIAAPSHNGSVQCKKYVHSVYYICQVTVFHLGDLPAVEELDNNDRSRRALQPLLCPCPEGYTSWLCPSAVQEVLALFQHDVLCKSETQRLNSSSTEQDTTQDFTSWPPTEQGVPESEEISLENSRQTLIELEKNEDSEVNDNVIGVD